MNSDAAAPARRPPAGGAAGHPEPRLGRGRARHGRSRRRAGRGRLDRLCRLGRRPDGARARPRRRHPPDPAARLEEPAGDAPQRRRAAEIIRRHKIDIVHARSRAPAWSAWSAARATGRHFVTTFHNAYDAGLPLKRWYNSVMARGERVIAISEFVAEHAAERLRRRPGPAAHDPARRRSRHLRPAAGRRRAGRQRWPRAMAGARRRAGGHAAGPADALEGRARLHRRDRPARPPRHLLPPGRRRAAPRLPPRARGGDRESAGWSACSASSRIAATCRPPTCWPMSSSRPRPIPRGSAGSSSRRRRWAGRSSPPITAAPARRSSPASPAGWCRRATRPRWPRRSARRWR